MKARVIDIEDNKVTVKTENGKFITVPLKKLKFDCHINQTVVIEKNEDKIYIVPEVVSFWDDDEPKINKKAKNDEYKKKKHTSGLTKTLLIIVLILTALASTPIIISIISDAQERGRISNLNTCLSDAQLKSFDSLKNSYSKNIECYEKYGGNDAEKNIDENKRLLETANIQECLNDAENNYKVTDEERENAGSDLGANMILVKRYGEKFKAQKSCYTKYGKLNDYSSEINKIDADITENQSMIDYGESAQKSQDIINQSRRYNSSVHCTTNSYGTSAYTNCY